MTLRVETVVFMKHVQMSRLDPQIPFVEVVLRRETGVPRRSQDGGKRRNNMSRIFLNPSPRGVSRIRWEKNPDLRQRRIGCGPLEKSLLKEP